MTKEEEKNVLAQMYALSRKICSRHYCNRKCPLFVSDSKKESVVCLSNWVAQYAEKKKEN